MGLNGRCLLQSQNSINIIFYYHHILVVQLASLETTGVRQELLGENVCFCVSQSYMDSVYEKRPPRKRDKTKAPPESKADLF